MRSGRDGEPPREAADNGLRRRRQCESQRLDALGFIPARRLLGSSEKALLKPVTAGFRMSFWGMCIFCTYQVLSFEQMETYKKVLALAFITAIVLAYLTVVIVALWHLVMPAGMCWLKDESLGAIALVMLFLPLATAISLTKLSD